MMMIRLLRSKGGGHVDLDFIREPAEPQIAFARELNPGRHNTDDLIRLIIKGDRLSDDLLIGAKAPLPQTVADYHHAIVPRLFFLGKKFAPVSRLDAEDGEEIRRGYDTAEEFRLSAPGEV